MKVKQNDYIFKCPDCGSKVDITFDEQRGLTTIALTHCNVCGSTNRRVVEPKPNLWSSISSVPNNVREQLRNKREDKLIYNKHLWGMKSVVRGAVLVNILAIAGAIIGLYYLINK